MTEMICIPADRVLKGRYRIVKPVGCGAFSTIYEATDLQTGRKTAVKECSFPMETGRFLDAAKLLREYAGEDAIVTVLDAFEEDGTAYIIMEFLEGMTLRECIEKNGIWTMGETLHRFYPIMKTLEHMHTDNVIHGDISPDNIMVLKDDKLRLLGLSAEDKYRDITLTRLVSGARYVPPEQLDAKGASGSWSDVYSVCSVLYYCITGEDPDDAVSRLMLDDLKKPSELDADIMPAAEKTLMRGLALDGSERVRSMTQLICEFKDQKSRAVHDLTMPSSSLSFAFDER